MTDKKSDNPASIYVGTSGYSYKEWTEAGFYPAGTRDHGMLAIYAQHFSATELNYTWYRMPDPRTTKRQLELAPPGFQFAAKLTRTMTHEVDDAAWRIEAAAYRRGVEPLFEAGQLAAVLAQMPPGFDRSLKNRAYLAALLDELQGLPIAVEFRNDSWANPKVYDELAKRGATLVAVDEPPLPRLFPPLDVVTNPDLFYVRFHGRNAAGWRSGRMMLQFDYDYPDDELSEWIEHRIERMARHTQRGFVFFNNHVRGQAPRNARRLMELLAERGLT